MLHLLRDQRPVLDRIAAVLLTQEVLEGDVFTRMVREEVEALQGEPDQALA